MNIFDLYTDYLQITPGLATATGLSSILDKAVSHDQVTRMLANHKFDSEALWRTVKFMIRAHEYIKHILTLRQNRIRKRIATSISQLTESFSINTTKARSFHDLLGRINRKILSYTTALFFNYQLVKDQFTQLELLIQA